MFLRLKQNKGTIHSKRMHQETALRYNNPLCCR